MEEIFKNLYEATETFYAEANEFIAKCKEKGENNNEVQRNI